MAGGLSDRSGKAYKGAPPLLIQGAMKVETSHIVEPILLQGVELLDYIARLHLHRTLDELGRFSLVRLA